MNNANQTQTLRRTMRHVISSDASTHLGNAFREVLLAMRSVVDAVIESKEQSAAAKLQKITVESNHVH